MDDHTRFQKTKASLKRIVKRSWGVMIVFLLIGLSIGSAVTNYILGKQQQAVLNEIRPVRLNSNQNEFINPLLGYNIGNIKQFNEFKPLERTVLDYINDQKQKSNVTDVSIYFRDLALGRWTGINENAQYDPASMLKTVIMIAYFKEAETDPGLLSRSIPYTQALDSQIAVVPFEASSTLQIGKSYTVEQLIEAMIINSDNGAKNALLANIDNNSLNEVYTDLGLQAPPDSGPAYTISAKSFSTFLAVLYNSTYLDQTYSEKALELLHEATYKDGLVAGVPGTVLVAQKYGEHANVDSSGNITSIELSDCGIIYKKNDPYILCVMTRGNNLGNLTAIIQTISRIVYQSSSGENNR